MSQFTRPVAFHFSVSFADKDHSIDSTRFQEVSGLETSPDTEPLAEGGENRFSHQLPKPTKHSALKLKRSIVSANSELVDWCKSTLEGNLAERIEPKDITVSLIDRDGKATASWAITNAYPVKWELGAFDAMKNELAIEAIELAYSSLQRRT